MDDEKRPDVFLQWKNTDACMDLWCACGADLHFDGYFADELTCGHCGQTWKLPHKLEPQAVKPSRQLKLVFDEAVLPALEGAEFTIRWPQPTFGGAEAGDIVEIHDALYENDVASSQRSWYADLLIAQAVDGAVMLTLRSRSPVR